MDEPKRIYVAATAQNDGKTTVSMGLIAVLREKLKDIGFIKPVGQRYLEIDGQQVDEDSYLVARVWGAGAALEDASPVAIDRGFTRRYIDRGDNRDLQQRIETSFRRVAGGKDLVIIEGTGHAGVGSVFGLSNARVARMLRAKVLLVTGGGVGRPVDQILLNKALFDAAGVPLAGVIVNKVLPDKFDEVSRYVTKSLAKNGVRTVGFLPHEPVLASSTVSQVCEELKGEVLNGAAGMNALVRRTLVGAMSPHRLLDYLREPGTLLITPGDREDVLLTALIATRLRRQPAVAARAGAEASTVAGIVLTGGIRPHQTVLNLVAQTDVPVVLAAEDTYRVASRVHVLIVKIQPTDTEKIGLVRSLVKRHVDIDYLLDAAAPIPE